MNLDQTVRAAGARFGERSAYVSPTGWHMTYTELDLLVDELVAGLGLHGVSQGSVVAAVMSPRPEYVAIQAACARMGAVIAGINHKLSGAEQRALLELCRPSLVVADPDAGGELASGGHGAAATGFPLIEATAATSADEALDELRERGARPDSLAEDPLRPLAIVFTSGTTGTPRGAVYAQRQVDFITQVDTGGRWGDPGAPPAHGMSGMSLTHLGPTTKLQGNLMRGGTTHLLRHWSPTTALDLVERHRMPVIAGVPTQVALMLHHPDLERYDLSSVQAVVMGGAPVTPALVREARERLGVPVMVRYSCTEAGVGLGTVATDDPADAECSVGRPHDGVELTIRDDTGDTLPPGETGEVCLASPATMSGYWRDPETTGAATWPDGAIRTGDLGHVDDEGRLRLSGRTSEMYVRGGYNVHPVEVEAVLSRCPGVAELAVVSRPDDVMGEVGVAVIVPEEGSEPVTLESLRAFGESGLARHKLPEAIVVTDQLPLTPMEKLDRAALRSLAQRSG